MAKPAPKGDQKKPGGDMSVREAGKKGGEYSHQQGQSGTSREQQRGANEVEGVTLLTIHSARPRRERKGSSTATADIRRAVANPGVFSVFSICPDQVQQRDKVRGQWLPTSVEALRGILAGHSSEGYVSPASDFEGDGLQSVSFLLLRAQRLARLIRLAPASLPHPSLF